MTIISGRVADFDQSEATRLDGWSRREAIALWSNPASVTEIDLFVADLGQALVTSCFIPIAVGSGTLFLDQTYHDAHNYHTLAPSFADGRYTLEYDDAIPVVPGTTILIGGTPENNWYHWLMNWLPRLFMVQEQHPELFSRPDVRFAFHTNAEAGNKRAMIDLFGIDPDRLIFFDPAVTTRFERLLVPRFINQNYYCGAAIRRMRDWFRAKVPGLAAAVAGPAHGMWISREQIPHPCRRTANIADLQPVFQKHHIKSVVLENLAFQDQAASFAAADLVIGVHGAGFANLIFCRDDAKMLFFDNGRNDYFKLTGMHTYLADVLGIPWTLSIVDEVDVEGTDYSQFYHLHAKDVVVPPEVLDTLIQNSRA
ncbi:hypothetical protein sos41_14940 [Alphaproteobacteria bacterium SO-S41]|nr:hypothetical protein sos41_14940 [Alphaproteobacteria bacterium SO-S41]